MMMHYMLSICIVLFGVAVGVKTGESQSGLMRKQKESPHVDSDSEPSLSDAPSSHKHFKTTELEIGADGTIKGVADFQQEAQLVDFKGSIDADAEADVLNEKHTVGQLGGDGGDKSCQDVWNNRACQGQFGTQECYTCGERISYLIRKGKDSGLAHNQVAGEFMIECGACGQQGDIKIQSAGYTQVWNDEFDTNGAVDKSKWAPVHDGGFSNGGFGNNELQYYTNRDTNSFVSDGTLKIRASREDFGGRRFTSAKLESTASWLYGKFSIRARLADGAARGTWAAQWMLPKDWEYGGWPSSGEIDIMEHVGYDLGKIHGTVHTKAYHHSIGTQLGGSITTDVKQWHVYTCEWRPDIMLFALDDVVYQVFRKEPGYRKWPFDKRQYLILNMAVGGNWGGLKGIDERAFEGSVGQVMEVDWVRVEQKTEASPEGATPTPTTPATPAPGGATPTPTTPAPGGGKTCQDVWNQNACSGRRRSGSCHTCGNRIDWLKRHRGKDSDTAQKQVAREFPAECGACA